MFAKINVYLIILVMISGCATTDSVYIKTKPPESMPGIYHEIQKGETLWSISKAYNVALEKLAKVNHIPDKSEITEGQLIFIPGAKQKVFTAPNYAKRQNFIWPVKGKVAFYFGSMVDNVINKGIDIWVENSQPVLASNSGRVVTTAEALIGYGNTIIIEHAGNIATVYSNICQIKAKVGEQINQGEAIATVKNGDYLHFELRKSSKAENPLFYLPR